jgi:hypothetical protein
MAVEVARSAREFQEQVLPDGRRIGGKRLCGIDGRNGVDMGIGSAKALPCPTAST